MTEGCVLSYRYAPHPALSPEGRGVMITAISPEKREKT